MALKDLNQAIKLNPQYAFPYYNRGIANRELKLYKQAEIDFSKYLELTANR
jgi:tetratricopeptide (TPR) repeat protein